jgi:hypothetical protein
MAVMTQLRPTPSKTLVRLAQVPEGQSVVTHVAGRLIQITLALYLLPAFLVALLVGGVGILIIKVTHLLTSAVERSAD